MKTDFIKSAMEKKKAQQADMHISPIAGFVFGVLMAIDVLGVIFGDGKISDALLGTWVVVWTLISVYVLFALKVANQW